MMSPWSYGLTLFLKHESFIICIKIGVFKFWKEMMLSYNLEERFYKHFFVLSFFYRYTRCC